ncbi:hypothetical protein TanjilG_07388 [Lupinus angustifolius]|uniref:Kunitz-type trypsin inhibitor-like 2 protein n=1 Tax=Lupinus angustifolius TaxID=3871 RepID=A0A4P1R092_LUPAN|nr:PREDICTED: kunitz-type trypsin inhibitor-like 2 protein [Lupinus angustifolius]OIV98953.1 hypothetical protein TanjilG_07388 [Lupinus angustifolius]
MKSTQLITLSFLLFAFTAKLQLAFSDEEVEQVVDVNGNPIFPGGKYYILPAIRGPQGGGLKLGQTGGSSCPVTVLQNFLEVENGVPIKFTIPGISPGEIYTGTQLDIESTKKPYCATSSKWIVFVDNDIAKACVGIGGPKDHPGKQTLVGKFHIQKYKRAYKLVFCITGASTCLDIGRYKNENDDEGGRRLNLTEHEPFELVFVDAGFSSGIKSVV